jgi:NAD(P)-dependent dehydrogenase (short-subunit alcohol dehydrogenase family)
VARDEGPAKQPLQGRVALVTGGSRGIGAGITRKLVSWGAAVAVNFVDRPGPARALAEELAAHGATVSLHQADVSEPEQVERLLVEVGGRYGDLHVLVHNAAAAVYAPLTEATVRHWEFVHATNSRACWLLARHAVPWMTGRPEARFITLTNSSTIRVIPNAGLFAAAKAGLETLTGYLAYELAPHGIVANCVRPGLVRTDVFRVRPDFEAAARREEAVSPWPERCITTVEAVADAVALLCLPEAGWIVGQTIAVDGGQQLWGSVTPADRTGSDAPGAVP